MIYNKNQKVTIQNKKGKYLDAQVLEPAFFGEENMWWVQFTDEDKTDISIYSSEQLNEWNVVSLQDYCVCGSAIAGSPRHATWCSIANI